MSSRSRVGRAVSRVVILARFQSQGAGPSGQTGRVASLLLLLSRWAHWRVRVVVPGREAQEVDLEGAGTGPAGPGTTCGLERLGAPAAAGTARARGRALPPSH